MERHFSIKKTKIDITIDNERFDRCKTAIETMSKLRKECEMEMKNIGLHDMEIFLVSSRNTNKADFGKLKAQLESGTNITNISRVRKRLALMQTRRQAKLKRQEMYIQTADYLEVTAASLDNESRNMKRFTVGAASVSLVCGIISSACILAAPATLGAPLIPGIVLGAISAVSTVTAAGSSVVERRRQETKVAETKAKVKEIETPCLDSVDATNRSEGKSKVGVTETIEAVKGVGAVTCSIIKIAKRGIQSGAATSLSRMAKFARVGGGIVGLVGVPFDVYTIVSQSMDLHKGNYSAVASDIRKEQKAIEKKLYRSAYKRRCPHPHRCAYLF